jgi:hypothetical protein
VERKYCLLLVCCLNLFIGICSAQLHTIPDHLGDSHFTGGPCPLITPMDGAKCPNNASRCAAFYKPALLPAGYNSVSYCSTVLTGIGFGSPGYTMLTMPLSKQEQQSFLLAAQRVQAVVKEKTPTTVVMEPYKVAYLDSKGNNNVFFIGNEYWNPVCSADRYLAPFSTDARQVVWSLATGYTYNPPLPDSYTDVVTALQSKNSQNDYPMALINSLPSSSAINVEWPDSVHAYNVDSNVDAYSLKNLFVAQVNNFSIPAGSAPITLCDSPAAMKMLGFGPSFNTNGHTINDINAPDHNPYVTLSGTDGAVVIPDFTTYPPAGSPYYSWIYDDTDPAVIGAQLPKAFYQNSVNYFLPKLACTDPTSCRFPQGVNPGYSLVGALTHEINHVLGVMSSQYYKVYGSGNALASSFGTALYPLDLFDLDSNDIASSPVDFASAIRNNNTSGITTILYGSGQNYPTPWIQWNSHDHLFTYSENDDGSPNVFPLMNESQFNPDGDIQFEAGYYDVFTTQWNRRVYFVDPLLINMPASNVVHTNVQAESLRSTTDVMTIREYTELSAQGWNVDYSTLSDPYSTTAPTWKWYQTCFDANGVFTTAKNKNCKFSVTPDALKFIQ